MALTVAAVTVFTWLSLSRHAAFQSHAFDLGNMDQAVWNTLHGRWLRFTDMQVSRQVLTTRLAIHVEPLLVPISLLYLIHSGPETLLVLQSLVVAAGAIPAYLLARDLLGPGWWPVPFAVAYLLHPSLQNVVLDDFHAVALSTCFLMAAILCGSRNRFGAFLAWGILASATKEEVSLTVAVLALVFFAARRRYLVGLGTAAAGAGWFLFCVDVIIPRNNPAGRSPYLARYAYLGHGLTGIVHGIVNHPGVVASELISHSRLAFLFTLLHPLGMVPIAGLPVLLAGVPAFAVDALSADPTMYSGYYQYAAELIPVAVAAAVFGTATVQRGMSRARPGAGKYVMAPVAIFVLGASLTDTYRYGFTPLAEGYIVPHAGAHQAAESRLLGLIPEADVVAAADEMEPHLSDRRWIYLLPTLHPSNGPAARWIALDASIAGLPVTPHVLHRVVVSAMRRGYGVVAADDGVLVLEREAGRRSLPTSFFRFLFDVPSRLSGRPAALGPLRLDGWVVHPRDGVVNRSRPALGVDTYWTRTGRIPPGARLFFALSPVYAHHRPPPSKAHISADSPAWDWLPLSRWPRSHTIHAVSLPLLPAAYSDGRVDVYVGFTARPIATTKVPSGAKTVRIGTVTVDW